MLPGVRRMERRTGFVVGVAAATAMSRPRTVVVAGGPGYYAPPVVVAAPPQPTVVVAPPAPVYQPYPPQPVYAPQPPPVQAYPPPQPAYPPQQSYAPAAPYLPPAAPYPQAAGQYPPPAAPYTEAAPAYAPAYVEPVKLAPAVVVAPAAPAAVAAASVAAAAAVAITEERRYFLIVNEANCSVLEVHNGNARPNAKVVLEKRRPKKPEIQSWFLDEKGVIRSRLNEYAMEAKSNGDSLVLMPYNGDMRQQWIFKDNKIVNAMLCSDVVGLKKRLLLHDDADVIVTKYEGKPYQHWRMEYI